MRRGVFPFVVALGLVAMACGDKLIPAAQPDEAVESKPEEPAEPVALAEPEAETKADPNVGKPAGDVPEGPAPKEQSAMSDLLARPSCDIEVYGIVMATRAGGGLRHATCVYEVGINGRRYRLTRHLSRKRSESADRVCEKNLGRTESVVRTATKQCKDLTISDRDGYGLQPIGPGG